MEHRVQAEHVINTFSPGRARRFRSAYCAFESALLEQEQEWKELHPEWTGNGKPVDFSYETMKAFERNGRDSDEESEFDEEHYENSKYVSEYYKDPMLNITYKDRYMHIYISVAKSLNIIYENSEFDFKNRTFYDLSGSEGKGIAAAGSNFSFFMLKSLEYNDYNKERARNFMVTARKLGCHWGRANITYITSNFLIWDFMDGDIVFFDATILGGDECILLAALHERLVNLLCGSYVIINCRGKNPFPETTFRLLSSSGVKDEDGWDMNSFVYKQVEESQDKRSKQKFEGKLIDRRK